MKKSNPKPPSGGAGYSVEKASPLDLRLDPQNPRLPPAYKGKPQRQLLEVMLDRFALDEIAESICTAGFLPMDPFIGYKEDGKIIILEGNRRLATLQLLLDAELTPDRYKHSWADFRRRLPRETLNDIKLIAVAVYADRRDASVLAYIGFRHVNGVLSWDAEEKAAFIAQLLEDKNISWSYDEIAKKIGSKAPYVEKLYVAHRLIEQCIEDEVPGAEIMRNAFGVLTRALQSPGIVKFLGITFPRDPKKSLRPATASKRELEDFVRWTFGTDDAKPVLEDSRDLTKWGQVLQSGESIRYLRTADDPRFERAYAKSGGMKEGLVDTLLAAADSLADAVPLVRQHRKDTDVQKAIERCTDYTVQLLIHFPEIAERQGITIDASDPTE